MSRSILALKDLFPKIRPARFVGRPNRFVVACTVGKLGAQTAFMPNPGRLWELLFPGVRLWVADHGAGTERKHRFTVLAVERDGSPVFLHTHVNNLAAETLLREGLIPGLEGTTIDRREVTVGSSRFDFLLKRQRQPVLVEVKSCTLFGQRIAMFPDAVTERGRRHVEELAALSGEGYDTAVVFVVHSPDVDWFMADYHTDLAFARTLHEARRSVDVLPVSVRWNDRLELQAETRLLPVPWDYVERESVDRGHYLLVLEIADSKRLPAGHYIALGWAGDGLDGLLAKCRKPPRRTAEPVLRLCAEARSVVAIPVRSSVPIESAARELAAIGRPTDENEETWGVRLVRCPAPPFRSRPFHGLIERLRMRPPTASS